MHIIYRFKQTLHRQSKKILKLSVKWKILTSVIIFLNLLVLFTTLCFGRYRPYLWLFYYSFFSNSPISWIIPLMPQEPILLLYGTFHTPWLVALTAGVATFMIEFFNYLILVPVSNLERLKPFKKKRFYQVLERYFNKSPFAIMTFVGFSPVPHFPFRLLAVFVGYSIVRYAFATFVGRTLFYYLVALTGTMLKLSYWVYVILLIAMIVLALITKLVRSRKKVARVEDPL